jgi:hypothetical protein
MPRSVVAGSNGAKPDFARQARPGKPDDLRRLRKALRHAASIIV